MSRLHTLGSPSQYNNVEIGVREVKLAHWVASSVAGSYFGRREGIDELFSEAISVIPHLAEVYDPNKTNLPFHVYMTYTLKLRLLDYLRLGYGRAKNGKPNAKMAHQLRVESFDALSERDDADEHPLEQFAAEGSAEEMALGKIELAEVVETISAMHTNDQMALLFVYSGITYEQLAQIWDVSLNVVSYKRRSVVRSLKLQPVNGTSYQHENNWEGFPETLHPFVYRDLYYLQRYCSLPVDECEDPGLDAHERGCRCQGCRVAWIEANDAQCQAWCPVAGPQYVLPSISAAAWDAVLSSPPITFSLNARPSALACTIDSLLALSLDEELLLREGAARARGRQVDT